MYKIIMMLLLIIVTFTMQAQQLDHQLSMRTLFKGKYAVDRAAHAAAQQLDAVKLSEGYFDINEDLARAQALIYLYRNLQLQSDGSLSKQSFLDDPIEIVVFDVIHHDEHFPYHYVNETHRYEVTLNAPGVVMMVKVKYPSIFSLQLPVEWIIKGSSELVLPYHS